MPASIALRPTAFSSLPSCGSSTITLGFWAISVSSAARCRVTSLAASTGLNVTSEYASACALALLVIAAIQPWSAAGRRSRW